MVSPSTTQIEIGEQAEIASTGIPYVPPAPVVKASWKRALDLIGAGIILLLIFPLCLFLAIIIRLTSPGPIFFRSKRIGLSGRPFYMIKFRSMHVDAEKRLEALWQENEQSGPVFKMKKDPRITPLGRFLRKYSIDELPQFLNVMSGEMSLVGPRPLHDYEVEKFDNYALQRLSVKPGLTCYWQVMGRSNLNFQQWMDLDHRYMNEIGLMTDLRILMLTPRAVLAGDGAC